MTRPLLLLALLLFAGSAMAQRTDATLTSAQYWGVTSGGGVYISSTFTSAGGEASCSKVLPVTTGGKTYTRLDPSNPTSEVPSTGPVTQHQCNLQYLDSATGTYKYGTFAYIAYIRTCSGATPYWSEKDLACKAAVDPPPEPCKAGPAGSFDVTTGYATGSGVGSGVASKVVTDGGWSNVNFCSSSCLIKPSGNPDSCRIQPTAGPNGYFKMYCTGDFSFTGSQCTAGPATPSPDLQSPEPPTSNSSPDGKCPVGSVAGGQDSSGMTVCIGTSKPPTPPVTTTEKPPVTTSNPDGGSTTTKQTTTSNADGSTTTKTTTTVTAPDGSTTTTVDMQTSPKPTGGAGTEDKPEDKSDLCKQNPHLTICKNSQVIGTCGEITCSGDAIQCATLRAAAAMECRDKSDREELAKSSLKVTGDAILAGTDPQKSAIDAALNGTVVDLSNPNLDSSGFMGGGACFAPMSINVMGHTVTQSFSSVCENILPLRYAIMLCASIIAYLIVGRTVLGN